MHNTAIALPDASDPKPIAFQAARAMLIGHTCRFELRRGAKTTQPNCLVFRQPLHRPGTNSQTILAEAEAFPGLFNGVVSIIYSCYPKPW